MLTWKFMGQVSAGIKSIPKAFGPENYGNLPKYPELDPSLIFKVIVARHPRALRYFPDGKGEWANLIAAWLEKFGMYS